MTTRLFAPRAASGLSLPPPPHANSSLSLPPSPLPPPADRDIPVFSRLPAVSRQSDYGSCFLRPPLPLSVSLSSLHPTPLPLHPSLSFFGGARREMFSFLASLKGFKDGLSGTRKVQCRLCTQHADPQVLVCLHAVYARPPRLFVLVDFSEEHA